MSRYLYILLFTLLFASCAKDSASDGVVGGDSSSSDESIVERLEDGRLRVSATLSASQMNSIEVNTRSSIDPDYIIYDGWCLVFGVDQTLYTVEEDGTIIDKATQKETDEGYGPDSPLLQKTQIAANTSGRFYMTFDETTDRVFMRVVANLSDREDAVLETVLSQSDIDDGASGSIGNFGQFLNQSVGLDGLYDFDYSTTTTINNDNTLSYSDANATSPDPSKLQNAFPMSSYGYVLTDGISTEGLQSTFNNEIVMIRIFSKIEVFAAEDSGFEIAGVTLLNGANEARIRSTVLSESGGEVDSFDVPENLGGSVQFEEAGVVSTSQSMPIYLYPNSGGNYTSEGVVNQDINPTYIVIRGKASGYSSEGYYKVAIKGVYPIEFDENGDATGYSDLTYDILRDNHFSINLLAVDKPGYATFADAASYDNPANNISYNITIGGDSDNRHEYLVSKGTYYMELETSRYYMKGYQGAGVTSTLDFSLHPSEGNTHPTVYIYSDDSDVVINSVTGATSNDNNFVVAASSSHSAVSIAFTATATGRICIRCGDMLKYIPVMYDSQLATYKGGALTVEYGDAGESWDNFAYTEIADATGDYTIFNTDGTIATNEENYDTQREFAAKIYPKSGDGIAKLYVKQATDFKLVNENDDITEENEEEAEEEVPNTIEYISTGKIHNVTGVVNYTNNVASFSVDGLGDIIISDVSYSSNAETLSNTTDYFTNTLASDNRSITFAAGSIYQRYNNSGYGKPAHVDYDFIRETTITVENTAGDTKEYVITQTQHHPIYFGTYIYSSYGFVAAYYDSTTYSGNISAVWVASAQYSKQWVTGAAVYSTLDYSSLSSLATFSRSISNSLITSSSLEAPQLITVGTDSYGLNLDPNKEAAAWVLMWKAGTTITNKGTVTYTMTFKDNYDSSVSYSETYVIGINQ